MWTTTPQINDLIGWMKKNNRAARAARFLVQCFDVVRLPNDDVKYSYLRFWRQRELAGVKFSFFALTWKPSKRKNTPPILYNVTNMEQSQDWT